MKKLLAIAFRSVLIFVALVPFIVTAVCGQESKTAEPKPAIDKSVTDKVDRLFAQWNKPDSPGCALGIIKDGRLIYKRGYGMANLEHNNAISSKSAFNVMSMTKQFTAMSILLLARQGKLSLDDDIRKYLPELPRYQSPVTIRHLIHHTSGIRNFFVLMEFAGMRWNNVRLTDDDFLELLARQKELNHKPGAEHLYSNTNYFLLGQIVQRVSGKSLREFADENIFKPLGMNDTLFVDDRALMVKNRATGYAPRSKGGFALGLVVESSGASGLYTSVDDLFRWDQNFYDNKLGGGPDLIGEAVATGILNDGEKLSYAFGLVVGEYEGLKTISHAGNGDGFGHELTRFPEQKFSVMRLCNAGDVNTYVSVTQLADIFLADQFKRVATTVAPSNIISVSEKELSSLTGLYFNPITEVDIRRYYLKDGKLMIDPNFNRGPSYELSPIAENRFKIVGAPPEVVFVHSAAGGNMKVVESSGGKIFGTLERIQSVSPTSAQLAEYTGRYLTDELAGAIYTLSVKDGQLILQVGNGITSLRFRLPEQARTAGGSKDTKDTLMTPAFADAFITFGGSATVRFTRDREHVISGFTLSNRLARRLRFKKQ